MKVIGHHFFQRFVLILLLTSACALAAHAQELVSPVDPLQSSPEQTTPAETPPVPVKILTNFVEAGGSYQDLSDNFGRWSGGYFRTVMTTGKNTWNFEVNGEHEFGDAGVYMDAGDTYNFNDNWYAALTFGTSVGGFFWPRSRVDGFLNRKWLARKQMITTLGFGYDHAKDVHSDHSFFVGTTYYFQGPWIIEDGVRLNISRPGTIFSPSGFVAVTQGRNKQHYLTANLGVGQEGYELVGPAVLLSRFPSQTATLTWRQWAGKNWGFDLVADFYHNPFYHRGGGSLGFFREF